MLELVEKTDLALVQFLTGDLAAEPIGAFDFGELPLASGARRPFHPEPIAPDRRGVAVAFDSEGVNHLAAGLFAGREPEEPAADFETRFFLEFPFRGPQRSRGGTDFPFRDRPRGPVFARPERSAGMDEKNL